MNQQKPVKYQSPNKKALTRLLRNKSAVFGIVIIVIASLIALLGYAIVPDSTPDADNQILELDTKEAGFKVQMLEKRKNRQVESTNFFEKMFWGAPTAYESIPINSYQIINDKIVIDKYTGHAANEQDTLLLADIVYPLQDNGNYKLNGEKVTFVNLKNELQNTTVSELKQKTETQIKSKRYLLGTDKFGRDNLSRLVLGVRVSLSIGIMAVLISLIIGIFMGAVAGYYRGWVDDLVMWIINVFWSIPLLLWVFALILAMGNEFWQVYLAVGLTMWVEIARIVRGQFFSIREKEFVEAAQSLGFNDYRIIVKHILPNVLGPLTVITAANFASAIIIEAGLSFLGIGVQPPAASWGIMLNEYYSYVGTSKAFLAFLPGTAILLLTLAFNLVGNGIRDALDVKGTG